MMAKPHHPTQKRGVAFGVEKRPGFLRIVVEFDSEMFNHIRVRAEQEGTSFAEQVRLLCEWGLEDARSA
jgi:hypothetical protein